jgi:hypothetical protein
MWPTDNAWANALVFAAAGYGVVLAAAIGSLLGRSSRGRRLLKAAPLVLAGILMAYLASALLILPTNEPEDDCIYSSAHPSDCKR